MANNSQVAAIAPPIWVSSVTRSFHSLVTLLVTVLVISAVYLSHDQPPLRSPTPTVPTRQCDLFSGRWVYDDVSYPLYKEKQCPYMSEEIACETHGRKDLKYQKWRWQPHGCDLPRFDATSLLEKLRNKRLVYVGDSLNRGQWHSLVCMVEPAIPPSLKSISDNRNASLRNFRALFYWAPLLVGSNCDEPKNNSVNHRIVRVKAIQNHAKHWSDADFLSFNTYLRWRIPEMELLWGSLESPNATHKVVKMPRAYEMALNTWSDWLQIHVMSTDQRPNYSSLACPHLTKKEWGGIPGGSCYGETEPIMREGYWGTGSVLAMLHVVETVIKKLQTRGVTIHLLNITQLSEHRKEAHPTIHRNIGIP